MRRPTRILLAAAGSLALAAPPLQAQPRGPAPVTVAAAEVRPLSDRIEALGTLRANESVNLTANVTEIVSDIEFQDGQRVKKGQVLARMEKDETHALLDEAVSTAEEAQRQYERTRQLSTQGAASTAQLDEARRVSETARARQLAIESRIKDRVITAPFDGVIGLRNISAGALVRPGDLIATIDDDAVMKLDFTVPASLLGSLRTGAPIEARAAAFGDRVFSGEVSSVDSRIDPVTRSVIVRATLPNPDRLLRPGLLMAVELLSSPRDALLIPEEAVLPQGRNAFAMTVEESSGAPVARRTAITLGTRRDGMVEVLSGLQPGARVITHGATRAMDGAAVEIQAAKQAQAPAAVPN